MEQLPAAIAGLSLTEIEELLPSWPRFRARQIYKWIAAGACAFEEMTDIPVSMRKELSRHYRVFSSAVESCHEDSGAKKTVFALKDGAKVEAVLLSDGKKRLTACLSTQAGCPAACVFCKTGSLGFRRSLDSAEIVEQFLHLRNAAASGAEKGNGHIIDNIVVMGMGEPLLNLANLKKAIAVLTDSRGIYSSRRRITISTCGICEGLLDIAENGPFVRLAFSLTTADEELRHKLMPITAANPLQKAREALILYQRNGGGRITLEVPLLGGINTRGRDADLIAGFARGMDTVVNIIPWNPVAGLEFEGIPLREPEKKETENFISMLESRGVKTTMRLRKGRRIMGACGQLGFIEQSN